MGSQNAYLTESEVQVMLLEGFKEFDREVTAPRHSENLRKFDALFSLVDRMKGAMWFGGAIIGIPLLVASVVDVVKFFQGR